MAWWWFADPELKEEIRGLRVDIVELKARKAGLAREVELSDEVVTLKTEISSLKIDASRLKEAHEREDRELRHMIGLEKKRQEVETAQATREAKLTVREENLAADRKRFEAEMQFQGDRFKEEVGYLKSMLADILGRLPNVNVALEGKAGKR